MIRLLDTHICFYIINKRPPQVAAHFEGLVYGDVAVSSITGAELAFGVAKSGSARNQDALEKFLAPLEVLPFDAAAMVAYGTLRAQLQARGAADRRTGHVDSGARAGTGCRPGHQQPRRICARAGPGM